MDRDGYDFCFKNWVFRKEKERGSNWRYWTEVRRRVMAKFDCQNLNCKEKKGEKKCWASPYGVAVVQYQIHDLEQFLIKFPRFQHETMSPAQEAFSLKYPKIVLWQMMLYREKCSKCKYWAKGQIFETHLENVCKDFCYIIANHLDGHQVSNEGQPYQIFSIFRMWVIGLYYMNIKCQKLNIMKIE